MKKPFRGMRCSLPERAINKLLLYFSHMAYKFYIPWCLEVSGAEATLPESWKDLEVNAQFIQELESHAIWELILHIYPAGMPNMTIKTYEDFMRSSCLCCMIYYDCGWMDIYIKDAALFDEVQKQLRLLAAEDLEMLTDSNDGRTVMYC